MHIFESSKSSVVLPIGFELRLYPGLFPSQSVSYPGFCPAPNRKPLKRHGYRRTDIPRLD